MWNPHYLRWATHLQTGPVVPLLDSATTPKKDMFVATLVQSFNYLPLNGLKLAEITRGSNYTGIFLPTRSNLPPALVFNWGDTDEQEAAQTIMYFEGEKAFEYFDLDIRTKPRGLLIENVEVGVDLSSRYDAQTTATPKGGMVMKEGRAHINAAPLRDTYGDPHLVPLPFEFGQTGEVEPMGFYRWKLYLRKGDDQHDLLTFDGTPAAALGDA